MNDSIIIPQNDVANVDVTSFQGDSEFNIIGMYYLSHKEPHNLCVIYGEPYQPDHGIGVNIQVSKKTSPQQHHHTKACVKLPHRSLDAIPPKQTDVSLRWIQKDGEISVPKPEHKFWENFTTCSEKRFVTCPFGFNCNDFGHANYLLFDKRKKTLERFESFGAVKGKCISDTDVDIKIEKLFRENLPNEFKDFTYIRPLEILPKYNVQTEQEKEDRWKNRIEGNPVGFCSVWSIWYIDLRTSNPDVPPQDLIEIAINKIKNIESERENKGFGKGSFTDFIRRYSLLIVDLKESLEREYSNKKLLIETSSDFQDGSTKRKRRSQKTSTTKPKGSKKRKGSPKKTLCLVVDIPQKGKGVIALSNIKKGTYIVEYGNIRYNKSFNVNCQKCKATSDWPCPKHNRLMQLPDQSWLDCNKDHISGYINHNSEKMSNCIMETFSVRNSNQLHVYIRAKRDIKKGEELTYNYHK